MNHAGSATRPASADICVSGIGQDFERTSRPSDHRIALASGRNWPASVRSPAMLPSDLGLLLGIELNRSLRLALRYRCPRSDVGYQLREWT